MSEHNLDDAPGIVYHPEDDGKPCLGCFVGAIFDSLTETDLVNLPTAVDDMDGVEDEDPRDVEFARKLGATFAIVADKLAALAVQLVGDDAEVLIEPFHERLDHMIVLINSKGEGHVH
jgi:hypothetical protein